MSGQETGENYDLGAVMDGGQAPDIADGALMRDFVEAVMARDETAIAAARDAIENQMGTAAMLDAAAVIAAFNAYPRIADATGIPLEDAKAEATAGLRAELDLDRLAS